MPDYCFFIGRFKLQNPHEADCAPVHFASAGRTGTPKCGQLPGNKSVRWIGSAAGAEADGTLGLLEKSSWGAIIPPINSSPIRFADFAPYRRL